MGDKMVLRIIYNGVEIQCEKADDAVRIAKMLGANGSGTATAKSLAKRELDASSFKDFLKLLKKNQKRLLKALASGRNVVTDNELQKELGIDDNRKIGGILSGLSKNAKRVGLDLDSMWASEVKHNEHGRFREFTIHPALRKAAQDIGGVK